MRMEREKTSKERNVYILHAWLGSGRAKQEIFQGAELARRIKGIYSHERWLLLLENECLNKGFPKCSTSRTH